MTKKILTVTRNNESHECISAQVYLWGECLVIIYILDTVGIFVKNVYVSLRKAAVLTILLYITY